MVRALAALQRLLPAVALRCNTAKSSFAYFHQHAAPLPASLLRALGDQDIAVQHDWIEVMGAAVGRDTEAVKLGLACLAAKDNGSAAFFRRLQSPELPVQSAMLVLRQCAVPKLNYLLRCSAPVCIQQQAADFDDTLIATACAKLELRGDERSAAVKQRLRLRLKDGGFGLTSAAQTSLAAYIASLAAVRDTAVFAALSRSELPDDTLLHCWLEHSLDQLQAALPGVDPDAKLLPPCASQFFSHYASAPASLASSLQRSISALANEHHRKACLTAAKELRRDRENGDGGHSLALFTACSARHASAWKRAAPTQPLTTRSCCPSWSRRAAA